jgi:hypothetical protein
MTGPTKVALSSIEHFCLLNILPERQRRINDDIQQEKPELAPKPDQREGMNVVSVNIQ